MKPFYWLLAFSLSALIASAQSAARTVKLVGIVAYNGNAAILDIGQTNHYSNQTEQHILGAKDTEEGVEVENVDADKGIVTAKVDGETRVLVFDDTDGSKSASSTIRLRDAKLQPLVLLYGEAKGRTVLRHPKLEDARFTLAVNPEDKPQAAKAFEELFASQKIAAIPDGDKFVLLVPYALTNRVMPRSSEFEEPGPVMRPLSINLQGVPLQMVLQIYGEYVNHPVNNSRKPLWDPIYLVQENSLSRGQICYAMETLFSWHDIRMVTNKDNTLSWEKIP